MNYEEQVKRLDEILKALGDNNTPLSDAITLFEEGKKICEDIEKTLTDVENKINVLTKQGLKPIEE